MTRNTSQRYTLAETIEFVRRAFILDLMTAMPGEVIEYTAATRRAKVRGSFRLVLEDGTTMQRSQIHDVPVAWPQAGGYALHQDLKEGDPVLLLFMQRDMESWKKEHKEAEPGPEGLLSEKDAVAIPGFGPPPSGDPLMPQGKASLQTLDGMYSVHIDADAETVTAKANMTTAVLDPMNATVTAPQEITLTAPTINLEGNVEIPAANTVEHGGTNIGMDHVHSGVQTGAGVTGTPQ